MAKTINKVKKKVQKDAGTPKKVGAKEWIRRILFWVALLVFIGSSAMLGKYYWTYYSANKGYEDIFNLATLGSNEQYLPTKQEEGQPAPTGPDVFEIGGNGVIVDEHGETIPAPTVHQREDMFPPNFPGINHALLTQMNPDYVGYIVIPGTLIQYPVVQGSDNSHYLRYDFNGKEVLSGCPFLDCMQEKDLSLFASTICAHNQKDDRMFGTLARYRDQKFWKENPYVYIMTPTAAYRYKIFAAHDEYYVSSIYSSFFTNEQAKKELLDKARSSSLYDTGVEVTTKNRVLVLYTCTADTDYRFVVYAVCEND